MSLAPPPCPACLAAVKNMSGDQGEISFHGNSVPYVLLYVCSLDLEDDQPPYCGLVLEIRPQDEATGLAMIERLKVGST